MDYTKTMLREVMELSPAIDNRISELSTSILIQAESPEGITTRLLEEALSMLVSMLHDNGLDFYSDHHQLLTDRHNVDYLCSLYQRYSPSSIIEYIGDNEHLRRTICSTVLGVSDNEFIVKVLEAVRDSSRLDYDNDMYDFLHDKVISSSDYATTVMMLLTEKDKRMPYDEHIPLNKDAVAFLTLLTAERKWCQTMLLNMIQTGIKLDYDKSIRLASRFCTLYSHPEYLVLLSQYQDLVLTSKDVLDRLMDEIRHTSVYYVEYYTDQQLHDLDINMLAVIVITQYSDKRLFDIEPSFKRLLAVFNDDVTVTDLIRAIPIQNKV